MSDENSALDALYRSYLEQTEKEARLEELDKERDERLIELKEAKRQKQSESNLDFLAKEISDEYEESVLDFELKILARQDRKDIEELRFEFARDRKRMLIRIRKQIRDRKITNEISRLQFLRKDQISKTDKFMLIRDLRRLKDIDVPIASLGFGNNARMIENAKSCGNVWCKHTRIIHFGACMVCARCKQFEE